MVEAALAGVAIGYFSQEAIAPHLASGRLVELLSDWSPSFPALALYYPNRRHMPAGLRAFLDLVRERHRQGRRAG